MPDSSSSLSMSAITEAVSVFASTNSLRYSRLSRDGSPQRREQGVADAGWNAAIGQGGRGGSAGCLAHGVPLMDEYARMVERSTPVEVTRIHIGFTAQGVAAALRALGLDPKIAEYGRWMTRRTRTAARGVHTAGEGERAIGIEDVRAVRRDENLCAGRREVPVRGPDHGYASTSRCSRCRHSRAKA